LPEVRLMPHARTETMEERLVRLIDEALDLARCVRDGSLAGRRPTRHAPMTVRFLEDALMRATRDKSEKEAANDGSHTRRSKGAPTWRAL
jgi:hypothetical protein